MNTSTRKSMLPMLAVGITALVVGLWSATQLAKQELPVTEAVTVLPQARALPDITLTDKNGQQVGKDFFRGKWSLVFMGFTSCGHICPAKMAELRMIHDRMDKPLQPVFVSVDPGRDTPEVIKSYVDGFDADFAGMTGAEDAIAELASALGAPYFVDPNPERYIVDHSSALFLVGPDAALVGVITPPFDIPVIVADLQRLQ